MYLAGNTGVAHTHMSRKKNIWFSTKDGNWNDADMWVSNGYSKSVFLLPQIGDTVVINAGHIVNINITTNINELFVYGTLISTTGPTLTLEGNLTAPGIINFSGANPNLRLKGYWNYIANFYAGTSTVTYMRNSDQQILDLPYYNLSTDFGGVKYLTANLKVYNTLGCFGNNGVITTSPARFECGIYNVDVGSFNSNSCTFSKDSAGSILCRGNWTVGFASVALAGNPTVEIWGDVTNNTATYSIPTTNSWTFTKTSTKSTLLITTSTGGSPMPFHGPVLIKSGTTLSINMSVYLNTSIALVNGEDSTSKLLMNGGLLRFNAIQTTTIMTVGSFDWLTNVNTLEYTFIETYTLPYTQYRNLTIDGRDVGGGIVNWKTLSGHTTVTGNFLGVSMFFELGSNDFTTTGTFNFTYSTMKKSAFGKITAGGLMTTFNTTFDLTVGNPDIEIKNGWNLGGAPTNEANSLVSWKTGTGQLKFSTNNQSFILNGISPGLNIVWSNPILISGAITLTTSASIAMTLAGGINGDNAASKLLVGANFIKFKHASAPMLVGILDVTTNATTIEYGLNGNQDIKGGNYRNLIFSTGGVKKLLGNINVAGTYSVQSPAIVDLNGFTKTP